MSDVNNPYKSYYNILELKPGASYLDVKIAYQHLKKLYTSKPLVLSPIIDDIPEEKRNEILSNLDKAYEKLKEQFVETENIKIKTTQERVANNNVPEFEVINGNALKLTREVLGIDLKEVSLFTGIPIKHLQNLEGENFSQLPPKGYIKVFLKKYAEYLSLDPIRVVADYFKHCEIK